MELFKNALTDHYKRSNDSKILGKSINRRLDDIKFKPEQAHEVYQNKTDSELKELITIASVIQREITPKKFLKKFFMCDIHPSHFEKFGLESALNQITGRHE